MLRSQFLKQLEESAELEYLFELFAQAFQVGLVSVAARMLVDVEEYAQATAGDVVKFSAINDDIAVCTFKNWCKATFGLRAGCVVEVANESNNEPSFLFGNGDVKHILI